MTRYTKYGKCKALCKVEIDISRLINSVMEAVTDSIDGEIECSDIDDDTIYVEAYIDGTCTGISVPASQWEPPINETEYELETPTVKDIEAAIKKGVEAYLNGGYSKDIKIPEVPENNIDCEYFDSADIYSDIAYETRYA